MNMESDGAGIHAVCQDRQLCCTCTADLGGINLEQVIFELE